MVWSGGYGKEIFLAILILWSFAIFQNAGLRLAGWKFYSRMIVMAPLIAVIWRLLHKLFGNTIFILI